MHNIITETLSDRRNPNKGITKGNILKELPGNKFPSIYIESDKKISVEDGHIHIDDVSVNLIGKSNLELVAILRDNAVSAYLTNTKSGMYPASLLKEFSSESTITFDVDTSPLRLSEYHSEFAMHLVDLSSSDIEREVISIFSNSDNIIYSDQDGHHSYSRLRDLLYVNVLAEDTKCLMKYKIRKYFLFSLEETIMNAKSVIGQAYDAGSVTPDIEDLLVATNGNNKDIL